MSQKSEGTCKTESLGDRVLISIKASDGQVRVQDINSKYKSEY